MPRSTRPMRHAATHAPINTGSPIHRGSPGKLFTRSSRCQCTVKADARSRMLVAARRPRRGLNPPSPPPAAKPWAVQTSIGRSLQSDPFCCKRVERTINGARLWCLCAGTSVWSLRRSCGSARNVRAADCADFPACSAALGEALSEVIATFGLVLVISLASTFGADAIPIAVAAFITSAYWFTSSTSFANPAVTFARAMTDTFAGISPGSVPLFVAGQILGGGAGTVLAHWLIGGKPALSPGSK